MRVEVKATGLLTRHLPADRRGNVADVDLEEGATPADVLELMQLSTDGSYLIVLNGENVPRAERATRRLSENDKLAIMPPLRGG